MKFFLKNVTALVIVGMFLAGIFGCQIIDKDTNNDKEDFLILAALSKALSDSNSAVARSPLALGEAEGFVILSKSGVTNVTTSAITGDVGSSPIAGSAILLTCAEVTGTIYSVDGSGPACKVTNATKLTAAVSNMETAYTDAAGRTPDVTELGAGNLGGLTITRGVYKWSSNVLIPADMYLSGGADDVWIFQISQELTVSNGVKVHLLGGALAKNVYWQTAGQTTIGTTAQFEGTILSKTAINLRTGARINGRMLAQTEVTLQSTTAVKP